MFVVSCTLVLVVLCSRGCVCVLFCTREMVFLARSSAMYEGHCLWVVLLEGGSEVCCSSQ